MTVATDTNCLQVAGSNKKTDRKKIWIDLDNSPHVPFFRPIIEELTRRDYQLVVTARDAYQVRELLAYYKVPGRIVGRHYGKFKILKALGTCWRALALAATIRQQKPDLAMSHGSRACLLAATMMGIPNITLADYEFVAKVPTVKPTWLMVPCVVPDDSLSLSGSRIMKYPGIKEDVYLSRFEPDHGLRERLGISSESLLITIRPPASEAHYHNPESDGLLTEALRRFVERENATIILLPRNKRQEAELQSAWATHIAAGKILIPEHVEDGMNLIWNSDLVISGGGTMNREAAAMGVPVYSIFRGKIGAVDRYLVDQGRLTLVQTADDISKIEAAPRKRSNRSLSRTKSPALETILNNVVSILEQQPKTASKLN